MPNAHLRFGNFLAPNAMPVYRAIARYVGQRLGCTTHVAEGTSYRQASRDFDVCFICGLAYVELVKRPRSLLEPIAAPVLQGERYLGAPIYFSDVVVRRDSGYFAFDDLRGRSWCYNEPYSQSGYGITRYWLAQRGETCSFFGSVTRAGWHERSIEWVRAGEIDASAIDCQVLGIAMREQPELREQLRVIGSLGPSTIQPVTVSRRLSPELRRRLQHVFLEMGENPHVRARLREAMIARFVPVDDRSYDDLREMQAVCESVGCLDPELAT